MCVLVFVCYLCILFVGSLSVVLLVLQYFNDANLFCLLSVGLAFVCSACAWFVCASLLMCWPGVMFLCAVVVYVVCNIITMQICFIQLVRLFYACFCCFRCIAFFCFWCVLLPYVFGLYWFRIITQQIIFICYFVCPGFAFVYVKDYSA